MTPDRRWYLIQYKSQEYKIAKTFELFRTHHIEPVLIKGWAAARNYPRKEDRIFLDIDVCVAPNVYERAFEIFTHYNKDGILIDLHNGLRHLDTVEWDDLFDNTELIEMRETNVRVLRAEDHLRVLCVHWLNDGAAIKDRLWDIYYAVENREIDFDWDRCLNTVDKERRRWIISAIGLAHLYLGLNLADTPIAEEVKRLPKWIIKTVEKEWADENNLKRLQDCLSDRKEFFRQLKKRFPPNPIQATVEVNGKFDDKPRIIYQIKDIILRINPSLQRFILRFRRK